MSYAVIKTGGKQYKVKSGEILKIEKLPDSKADTKIEFKEILAYGDDKMIEVGSPTVTGAKVEADLVKNGKKELIIKIDKKYFRPLEIDYLKGNPKKALKKLNYKLKHDLKDLVKDMIDSDIKLLKNNSEEI